MSLQLGNLYFDVCNDTLQIPAWSGSAFRQPGRMHAGVQLTPPAGEPFTITATRFDASNRIPALQSLYESAVGQALAGRQFDTNYDYVHGVLYLVLDVAITEARKIAHASGNRPTGDFSYTPACSITAQFQIVAVPV